MHAILYLIVSLLSVALLFFLLGAPFLAALEAILYAGAIMVLFLFIVMMLRVDSPRERLFPPSRLIPAAVMGAIYFAAGVILVVTDSDSRVPLQAALATPREFGQYVFQQHWLAVESISLLLLIAAIGVLHIGKNPATRDRNHTEEEP